MADTALPERADGAPSGPGLLPSEDPEQRKEYAEEIARNLDEMKVLPMRRAADKMLADIGLPPLPASLFASEAMSADLILQPCPLSFPLRESRKGALYRSIAAEQRRRCACKVSRRKKSGKENCSSQQGTIANNDLGKLLAPTILGLGEREDFLILATTSGRSLLRNIPCRLTPNTIASQYLDFGNSARGGCVGRLW